MDTNKIIELYIDTRLSQNNLIDCHTKFKKKYLMKLQSNNTKFNDKTNKSVSELKVLLAYLKKHHELKVIYCSYKDVLKHFIDLKKKFEYFSHISKPLISKEKLKHMVKQQENIMSYVDRLNKKIPKIDKLL